MEFLGFVLVLVLALVALSRGTRLDQEIHRLHERIDSLGNELTRLKKVVTSRLQEAPAHGATPAATLPAAPGPAPPPAERRGRRPLPEPPGGPPPPRARPAPRPPAGPPPPARRSRGALGRWAGSLGAGGHGHDGGRAAARGRRADRHVG